MPTPAPERPPTSTATSTTRAVLVVEDDPSVRDVVEMVLERAGYAVTSAADGPAALQQAADATTFDLVVLDLMLPGLDGFEVCRRLRRTSAVPVLVLTARADTADLVTALEVGADDYVTKPFEPLDLVERVNALLSR